MKLRSALLLLATLLLAGAPAQAAKAKPPKSQESELDLRIEQIDAQLSRREWAPAATAAREAVEQARQYVFDARFAQSLSRLALAEAGLGQTEDALWHWQTAQNMYPLLFKSADTLASFGAAGELLAANRLRRLDEPPAGLAIQPADAPGFQPARKLQGDVPELSAKLRELSVPKWLRLQAVIDEQGRLRYPVVVSPIPGMVYEVLAAARDWRFEPARKDGAPVAVLYDLVINPPAEKPLAEIAPLSGELAEVEALLRAQSWREARQRAGKLWAAALDHGDPSRGFFAITFALRALAEAGAGEEDAAICHWQAAQALEPLFYHADLSAYGAPGELLERFRWGRQMADRPAQLSRGDEISRPEIRSQATKPEYPRAARKALRRGTIIVQTLIDDRGTVRDPAVLQSMADPKGLDATALDSVCSWRFRPAVLAGRPVPIQYVLTVNYDVNPGASSPY
jgi:TonB family protein